MESTYAVWHITESIAELQSGLEHPEFFADKVQNLKPDSRRLLEVLAVRHLLKYIFDGEEVRVLYDEHGKPRLDAPHADQYLSISHTQDYAAAIISPTPCGIDIERRGRRVQKVTSHFLTPDELAIIALQPDPDFCLHLAWSAKETLYKVLGPDYYDLQHLTTIRHIDLPRCLLLFEVHGFDQPLPIHFSFTDDYVLTWYEEESR